VNTKRHTFVSIFSGCGGLDLGFENAGFRCVGSFDKDCLAVNVHNNNLPSSNSAVHDLADVALDDLIPRADLLVAGPPCQGFSTAGKMQENDSRNELLQVVVRIAKKINPKVIVIENVTGLKSSKMRHHQELLISNLEVIGYRTHSMVIDASEYGVPQRRKRVFIIAWSSDFRFNNDFDLSDYTSTQIVKDALAHIPKTAKNHQPKFFAVGTSEHMISKRIHEGQKLCDVRGGNNAVHTWDIPEVFGETSDSQKVVLQTVQRLRRRERVRDRGDSDPVSVKRICEVIGMDVRATVDLLLDVGYLKNKGLGVDLAHAFNGWYRRLDGSGFSPTVDTYFGRPKYFLHPYENRGLTVREAARIQTFPDSFVFSGAESEQYRMIGNAVPPRLAQIIADRIRRNITLGV
jgi:DNA (cytosine-5)-methyltransferase 1